MGKSLTKFKDENCTMSCCTDKKLSNYQTEFRNQIKIASCSISIIICLYVLFMAVLLKLYENVKELLVFNVLISGFLLAFFYLVNSASDKEASCSVLGFTMTYVDTLMIIWVVAVTIYMFIDSFNMWRGIQSENDWRLKYKKHWMIGGWLFPLIPCIIPLFERKYKPAGAWCWIESEEYRYSLYYGPWFAIGVGLFVITICAIVLAEKAFDQTTDNPSQDRQKVRQLLGYPVIFLISGTPSAINRVYQVANRDCTNYILSCFQTFFAPVKGFAYCVFFIVMYRQILFNRDILRDKFLNWRQREPRDPYTLDDIIIEEDCTEQMDETKRTEDIGQTNDACDAGD